MYGSGAGGDQLWHLCEPGCGMFGDNPPSVDYTWDPTQKPKEDVYEDISTDSGLDENRNGRYE